MNASGCSVMLIPSPLPLALPTEGILPEDEEGPNRPIDMGRLGPAEGRFAGSRGWVDSESWGCGEDVNPRLGDETMMNWSPSTWYVLPTSGLLPGLPMLEDDLALRSRGVDKCFFILGGSLIDVGRPTAENVAALDVIVEEEERMDDLTSEETVMNFSRTDAGTCNDSWIELSKTPKAQDHLPKDGRTVLLLDSSRSFLSHVAPLASLAKFPLESSNSRPTRSLCCLAWMGIAY